MKTLGIIPIILMLLTINGSSKVLKHHLWKHRVILAFTEQNLKEQWKKNKEDLSDRHIIYYQIDKNNKLITNQIDDISSEVIKEIRTKYYRKNTHSTQVVLIGKDGGVKNRSTQLDLNSLYALIDTMPMRMQEMQNKKK